jgi:glucose-6-phosphate isomerase
MMVSTSSAWQQLQQHFEAEASSFDMRDLFQNDPSRFNNFSINLESGFLLFDYSKNLVNQETMAKLINLAKSCNVEQARDAMFSGETINTSEGRAVLHTALRNPSKDAIIVAQGNGGSEGSKVLPLIHAELDKMECIADSIRSGSWLGSTGLPITDIVNIGIGGSDLGPVMVVEALKAYSQPGIKCHFVSNIDGTQIANVLGCLPNPETTLFIIVSKTFTTAETMKNAESAKTWILSKLNLKADKADVISKHFVAVSTNHSAVSAFGVDPKNMVGFWDWVGGRYSLWSAVGLIIMISVGPGNFRKLLAGAHTIDKHFLETPLEKNIPVIMGLLGVWYGQFWGAETHAVLPYEQFLHRFPAYLQQADMESNGKSVTKDGSRADYATGPIVWGEPGTNGQHAFFQLIHQGTKLIPADFIAGLQAPNGTGMAGCINHEEHHRMLLANFFAQTEALMTGKSKEKVAAEMKICSTPTAAQSALIAQRSFTGNRPTNTLLYRKLDPFTLGALVALYEHKIFVQGVIWNINSFDQWGVELGKQLANVILQELTDGSVNETGHDGSTNGLLNYYLASKH